MSSKLNKVKIAVVGATGNVGSTFLSILAERGVPIQNVTAVASDRSAGKQVSYGEVGVLDVKPLSTFDFRGYDIGLFSPGGEVSAMYAPKAAEQGCLVIDNTSHFRMVPDVPLIVPEVNPEALAGMNKRNIIANPNCSTIQTVMALKPLHDLATIRRVVVSTYQSVSGAGQSAMDELYSQTKGVLMNDAVETHNFPRPIAFNVIPQIGNFMEDGFTDEEAKMRNEIKKIMSSSIELSATCVRVPVFVGHAVSATVEFENPITVAQARQALKKFPGIALMDKPEEELYCSPIECAGDDAVFVSRIRKDPSCENSLILWIASDNVRKGAALNTIQIAELALSKR